MTERWIVPAGENCGLCCRAAKACHGAVWYVLKYVRYDKRGYVIPCNRYACRRHAERFARKFGLEMPK